MIGESERKIFASGDCTGTKPITRDDNDAGSLSHTAKHGKTSRLVWLGSVRLVLAVAKKGRYQ